MAWHDDSEHPFAGIAAKLKRADENIINLDSEIKLFIQSGKYPVLPYQDDEAWQEAMAYHREKPIPLKLGVLAGEIVHHFRSCLDHIIWHFSIPNLTPKMENVIEFPIFEIDPYAIPTNKDRIKSFERKIQGITNTNVLGLIKDMQPYAIGADMADHGLLIIHNMDRFDKHRELVIVDSSVNINFPPNMLDYLVKANLYTQGELPESEHLALSRAIQKDSKATPSVGFRNFGKWSTYPVIKGLAELGQAVDNAVTAFASEV